MKAYMPKVWWPGIRADIEEYVKACPVCKEMTAEAREAELYMNLPFACGEVFHADFFQIGGFKQKYLVVVDQLSSFAWVEKCDEAAESLKSVLSRIFAEVRPFMLLTDNGPGFNAENFTKFLLDQHVASEYSVHA